MFRCSYCGEAQYSIFRRINGYTLETCSFCHLLQTRTSEPKRAKYVKNKYTESYAEDYKSALPRLHKRFIRQVELIKKYKKGKRLLDVGCGTGHFLKYLKDRSEPFEIYGVEPSQILRRAARKNTNLPVKNGLLDSLPFPDAYFDVVTCYDVLEHSKKLKRNLSELKRVLKPGGLLFIQAPNYESIMANLTGNRWDWWCIPDHVLHFSKNTLINILKDNKFRILYEYTYEDEEDFQSNIKGMYSISLVRKAIYFVTVPLLRVAERVGWLLNKGGLIVVLAETT